MKILVRRPVTPLHMLAGCWPVACGPATTTGSGNPAPTLTKVPTLTPLPARLVFTFECRGAFTPSSAHEKICVRTLPGASLTIKVTYCTGGVDQSTALKGLFRADKTGYYEWSWTPKAICQGNPQGATGFWKGTAEVKVTYGGQNLTGSVVFLV